MIRFKFFSFSLAMIALMACGQVSETHSAVAQDTADIAQDMKWNVIDGESHLKFSAKQEGSEFEGEFKTFQADIAFDPENLQSSRVKVTIPLNQIDAGSRDRNSTLPDKAWFSTKAFPEAVWQSDEITKTGKGDYLATGNLTLKGITKPLDIPFTLDISDKAVMEALLSLDRTDWNVGTDPWDTDAWVSRRVNLDIKVTATR